MNTLKRKHRLSDNARLIIWAIIALGMLLAMATIINEYLIRKAELTSTL